MRILIADDEGIIRIGLREMLEELGHTVIGAAVDGATVVRLARELQPDLVILDIKMPGLDGLDAAQAIAAERPTPMIMLSAFSERPLLERAASLCVHGYLVKPVDAGDLAPALEVAAARFEQWQALQREAADLRDAMETRAVVERAKALLMTREGMSERQAFSRLQSTARRERRPMRAIAEEVLARG